MTDASAKTRASCRPPRPPIASITARASGESSIEPMLGTIDPSTTPEHAHPDGPAEQGGGLVAPGQRDGVPSRGEPWRGPGRSGSSPEPRSRRRRRATAPRRQGGRQQRVEQQHPHAGLGPGAAAGSTSRTGSASSATSRWCPPRRARGRGHRSRPRRRSRTCARCSRPGGEQGEAGADQRRSRPTTPRRAATRRPAARRRRRPRRPAARRRRRQRGLRQARPRAGRPRPTAVPPTSSARPALLLDAGVPADEHHEHEAPRTRRTGRSSWSSPARRGCGRRGSGRRARRSPGWR